MGDVKQEITKQATDSIKKIGKKYGPEMVLLIIICAIFFAYIFSEKRDCEQEAKTLMQEINLLKTQLASEKIERANCENILKMQSTHSQYNFRKSDETNH